jgi:hypothetical protein
MGILAKSIVHILSNNTDSVGTAYNVVSRASKKLNVLYLRLNKVYLK